MTSRSLSSDNRKHRLTAWVLSIFFAIIHIMTFAIMVHNIHYEYDSIYIVAGEKAQRVLMSTLPNFPSIVFTIALAVSIAITGYEYLHHKQMVDLYHGLPIKRSRLYHIINKNSLIFFLVPLLLSALAKYAVAYLYGYQSILILYYSLLSCVIYLLIFLLNYYAMTLALILTGNILVSLMAFGVFCIYAPLGLQFLYPAYATCFFDTYRETAFQLLTMSYFSPVTLAFHFTFEEVKASASAFGLLINKANVITAVIHVVFIILLSILCKALYVRRKSEAAGQAMAFAKTKSIIRFLIVLPLALYIGLGLYLFSNCSIIWLLVGIVLGTLLVHGYMEAIYSFDIHGIFHHPIQMIATALLACAISALFWVDPLGYDSTMPQNNKIAQMTLSLSDQNDDYYSLHEERGNHPLGQEEQQKILDKLAVRASLKKKTELTLENLLNRPETDYEKYPVKVSVDYKLKNHRKMLRDYYLSSAEAADIIEILYNTQDFKENVYPVLTLLPAELESISLGSNDFEDELSLNKKEREALLEAYQNDLRHLTFDQFKQNNIVSTIVFHCDFNTGEEQPAVYEWQNTSMMEYNIYDCFTETLAFLEAKGYDLKQSIQADNVLRIEFWDERMDAGAYMEVLDQKVIKETLPALHYSGSSDYLTMMLFEEDSKDVTVVVKKNRDEYYYSYRVDSKVYDDLLNHARLQQ